MGTSTKTLQYLYDSRGNRSALVDHDGGRFTYSYDAVNRITQVLNSHGDRTSYSYDSAGRRTLKKLSNGTRASLIYDAAGNLTKLYNLKSTGAVISSFDYAYDKTGNRTAVLEAGANRVTWSYDQAYQLTGEHRTGANAYRDTYTYDPAGNRLLKNHDGARTTYAYDPANQLTYSQDVSGRTTFTFDADGNQQMVREPAGNRTTYSWDYENRMTLARLPSGIRNTMAYDADGLRVKLEESTGIKKFVWDNQNYLGETDAANDTQVVYTNEPQLYGNLVSQRRASTSHWYHFDALGSTRELTDNSAVISDTRLYDAWGNSVSTFGATVSPLRWVGNVGYYFDAQNGHYYVRARAYSPSSGRWIVTDPLGTFTSLHPNEASGLSSPTRNDRVRPSHSSSWHAHTLRIPGSYLYATNRTIAWDDPSGLDPCVGDCTRCGADIQAAFRATLDNVICAWDSISFQQKWIWCRNPFAWLEWDIDIGCLVDTGTDGSCGKCRITRTGDPCVTIYGYKHNYWDVNYALWGVMSRLCGMELADALLWVHAHKNIMKPIIRPIVGEDSCGRELTDTVLQWTKVGWLYPSQTPRLPPSIFLYTFSYCKSTRYPPYTTMPRYNSPPFDSCFDCPVPAANTKACGGNWFDGDRIPHAM